MKKTVEWKKPEFICIETKDLMCKILVRANSQGAICNISDSGDSLCTGTDTDNLDTGGDIQCGILAQCIVGSGVALGCLDNHYCSDILPVL